METSKQKGVSYHHLVEKMSYSLSHQLKNFNPRILQRTTDTAFYSKKLSPARDNLKLPQIYRGRNTNDPFFIKYAGSGVPALMYLPMYEINKEVEFY